MEVEISSCKLFTFTLFQSGANVGDWSEVVIDALKTENLTNRANLVSYEPVPSTFATLRKRLGDVEVAELRQVFQR